MGGVDKRTDKQVLRKGMSARTKAAIVVMIFILVGVVMDAANHWHLLYTLMGH